MLYGATLNDTVLRLAEAHAFRPLWSEKVLKELHRHLAAIETVGAQVRDFPTESVAPFELAVRDPDEFLLDQLDPYPAKVASALRAQVSDSARPSLTLAQLLGILSRSGVPHFVSEAMRHDFDGSDGLDE